jgi:hypothetical protein
MGWNSATAGRREGWLADIRNVDVSRQPVDFGLQRAEESS